MFIIIVNNISIISWRNLILIVGSSSGRVKPKIMKYLFDTSLLNMRH